MELEQVFECYDFGSLDRSWIKQVVDSAFTNVENVPRNYQIFLESQEISQLLRKTCVVVKNWILQNSTRKEFESSELCESLTDVSWQTLIALNLDVRALQAVLGYLMRRGQAFDASRNSRQSCFGATSLYFILLSIPGSIAFQAFHEGLYEAALKTLTLSQRLLACDGKLARESQLGEFDDDFVAGDGSETLFTLPKPQSVTLTKGLNGVLYDLITMLTSAATSLEARSLERTIFHLVEITKLAEDTMSDFWRARGSAAEASTSTLAYNAYVALRLLCNPKYGTIPIIARTIGKYVLPQFLSGANAQLPVKQLRIVQDSTIHFLKTVLQRHGREAEVALIPLVQQLMIRTPERVEGRQKQAVLVIKLMNLYREDGNVYREFLKDLVRLSDHYKIPCRIFAQEIIGKYLLGLLGSQSNREEAAESRWSASKRKKLLLAAALSRCEDVSSMVRGRAIATFAEYTDSVESAEVREIFRGDAERGTTELPTLKDLEEAIDNNDVENILPSTQGIMAMLKRRGEDERALVRRSSLQALRNGILVRPELLSEAAPTIREHCRDTALTVRRFAIRVLTTLLERFPENASLCKDWVESVVPRVFDSEIKVQEEVLDSLEKLTIDIIGKRGDGSAKISADLPWRILGELTVNKMGDHLAKACNIWVSSETITNATIASIKLYIGTEYNVEAWLLLASIAENRQLGDMTKYYSYYERALREDSKEEGFLASVVIQVLRHCWSNFDKESLRKIEGDLLGCLKQYRVRETLISHCLDILHGIRSIGSVEAASGSKDNATTMRDLMRLSEATMVRLVEAENDDIEEEDPGKLLFRAICTLGHASFLCAEEISVVSLRLLQGFLLEWSILPARVRARPELQGAAVMVLGQQSLRDRDVAREMTPIFGRLLRNTGQNSRNAKMASGPAVRINTAKALADICVVFTALVEPYLPDMCVSMKDPNPDVRREILVIFIQLLAEDFIKINGPFFFHILSMLSDNDPTIRQMTVFLIKERLLSKKKSLITQQFLNSIFYFNDYERRVAAGRSQSNRRAKEREALTLPGEKGTNERRDIYDFLLDHLDAPGKLTVLLNLTRQILRSTCTVGRTSTLGELNVGSQKGICVFRDALYVLSSENLQPNSCAKQSAADEENLEDVGTTQPPTTTAAVAGIIESMKKHRLQMLLPGLVKLKRRFALAKSPLVLDVAKMIASLISDYNRDQLESLYNEYPKLDREIERDIRKFEGEERPEKTRKSSTPKKSSFGITLPPDLNPRIVLRRLSTPTNLEIAESPPEVPPVSNSENPPASNTRRTPPNSSTCGQPLPRIVLRRLSTLTYPNISDLRAQRPRTHSNSEGESMGRKRDTSPSVSERSSPRKTRSLNAKETR